jgi:hypothetical protein
MFDETPQTPQDPQELAALELYHQLVNLSPDDGDRALMVTLRLPNGRYVGDVWLSASDVEQLIDGALTISQHRVAFGAPEEAAGPLPKDDDISDEVADVMAGFDTDLAALLDSEGGQA